MVIKEVSALTASSSSKSVPETSTTIARDRDKLTSSSFYMKDDTLKAEVLLCLKLTDFYWSYHSSHKSGRYSS